MDNSQITFQPQSEGQSTTECFTVSISNDNILESVEMFTIEFQSTNPDVSASPDANRAMVVIMDDDRM